MKLILKADRWNGSAAVCEPASVSGNSRTIMLIAIQLTAIFSAHLALSAQAILKPTHQPSVEYEHADHHSMETKQATKRMCFSLLGQLTLYISASLLDFLNNDSNRLDVHRLQLQLAGRHAVV
ncbi:hypothetical protein T07_3570 [Trichinella nelsoni]|uniref:Uncharacterized protein n=1 Tax=Trichinella nelsoni TaxID=6336 RepID=A0A0V0RF08_9BILA|nr:hypothetical protein T07_3570 [Trichinella nelsoni]